MASSIQMDRRSAISLKHDASECKSCSTLQAGTGAGWWSTVAVIIVVVVVVEEVTVVMVGGGKALVFK